MEEGTIVEALKTFAENKQEVEENSAPESQCIARRTTILPLYPMGTQKV